MNEIQDDSFVIFNLVTTVLVTLVHLVNHKLYQPQPGKNTFSATKPFSNHFFFTELVVNSSSPTFGSFQLYMPLENVVRKVEKLEKIIEIANVKNCLSNFILSNFTFDFPT